MSEIMFNGLFQFQNVGRNKASFLAKLKTEKDFWRAIQKHLMSSDLEYIFDVEENDGAIFAGMRKVGTFKKVRGEK